MTASATAVNLPPNPQKNVSATAYLKTMPKKKTNIKSVFCFCLFFCAIALDFESESCYAAQDDLEFSILLPQHAQLLCYRYAPSHLPNLFIAAVHLITVCSITETHTQSNVSFNMLAYYRSYFCFFLN